MGIPPYSYVFRHTFHVKLAVVFVAPALRTLSNREIKSVTESQEPQRV